MIEWNLETARKLDWSNRRSGVEINWDWRYNIIERRRSESGWYLDLGDLGGELLFWLKVCLRQNSWNLEKTPQFNDCGKNFEDKDITLWI